MSDDRLERIEDKLDRCLVELTGHVAEDKAVHKDVAELKTTTKELQAAQDRQKGAINLVMIVSVVATIVVAFVEVARFKGGH